MKQKTKPNKLTKEDRKESKKSIIIQGIVTGLLFFAWSMFVYLYLIPESDIIQYKCHIDGSTIDINKTHNYTYACETIFIYGYPQEDERFKIKDAKNIADNYKYTYEINGTIYNFSN